MTQIPDAAVQALQEIAISKIGLMLTDEHAQLLAIAAIRALSAEPAQGEQCLSIKPKLDGTEYLTWNGRRYHVAKFDKVENEWVSSFTTVTKRLPISPQPHVFMPLPAAPTTEAGR